MKTIYLDFDGTVTDIWIRYYRVLNDFLSQNHMDKINLDEYKIRKKNRLFDHEIVKELSGQELDIEKYSKFKKEMLEDIKYLKLDSLIGEPSYYVDLFHQTGFRVEILTQRHQKENFMKQLKWLKIEFVFDAYTVVSPCRKENAKYQYLYNHVCKEDIMIGDSPVEKECAEKCHIPFLFVDSGLYTGSYIEAKKVYKDILEIANLFMI